MPATAGRVRMPANNRVHSSAALQTHGIWQNAIGYDPYAPENNKHEAPSSSVSANAAAEAGAPPSENAYNSFQDLIARYRGSSASTDESRGACKKCNRVGHLTYQCRNFLSVKTSDIEYEILAEKQAKYAEIKKKVSGGRDAVEEDSDEEDEDKIDSDSSDSDIDPVLEKLIAERERAKSHRGNQYEEKDKNTSRHRSSSRGRSKHRRSRKSENEDDSKERTKDKKDRPKKHASSVLDSQSDSDRKRYKKSRTDRKRRRTRKKDESAQDDRHNLKRRHHRRDGSDGDTAGISSPL